MDFNRNKSDKQNQPRDIENIDEVTIDNQEDYVAIRSDEESI
jgi:hypothetical protein